MFVSTIMLCLSSQVGTAAVARHTDRWLALGPAGRAGREAARVAKFRAAC